MGVCQQARRSQNTELHQVYLQLLDSRSQDRQEEMGRRKMGTCHK